MTQTFKIFLNDESGATVVEYVLIIALAAAAIISGSFLVGAVMRSI